MEQNSNRRTKWIVLLAIIILALCMLTACCALTIFMFLSNTGTTSYSVYDEEKLIVTEAPAQITTPMSDMPADDMIQITDALTEYQQRVVQRAEAIRGIQSSNPVSLVFLNQEEIRQNLIEEIFQNISDEDFQNEHDLLVTIGLIPESFDLKSFYPDLYSEQIAGYYDQDKNEMVLVQGGTEKANALTLAHEYTHFLQFDHFDPVNNLNYSNDSCEENAESCFAIGALLEGDATLTEILLTTESDLKLFQNLPEQPGTSVFEDAPQYFRDALLFPYTFGYDFVAHFYHQGGFEAVDELYANPPDSAEQIMHPERYPQDEPVEVLMEPFTNILARQCDPQLDNVLNEADLLWILGSGHEQSWRLSAAEAKKAAEGWGGGGYQLSRCEGLPLVFGKTLWDSTRDADEFYQALGKHFDRRWGRSDDKIRWAGENGEQVFAILQDDLVYLLFAPEAFDPAPLLELIQIGRSL